MGNTKRLHKVGGLYHWRIGRVGGSFYLAKRREPAKANLLAEIGFTASIGIPLGAYITSLFL
jgi:hypothetical protein